MTSLLKSAWSRLTGGATSSAAPARPVVAASRPRAADPAQDRVQDISPGKLGARRPLISANHGVEGFEFRIGTELRARFRRQPEPTAQAAYVAAILTSARLTAQSGRRGLARLPLDWLTHKTQAVVSRGVMVAVDRPTGEPQPGDDQHALLQNLGAMRAAGAEIGWPIDTQINLKRDFVLLRQGESEIGVILEQIKNWPIEAQGLPIVLTDVPHLEDVELALIDGIRYVCGAVAPREAVSAKDAQILSPEAQRIAQILQQLVTGAETAAIVEQIKADVGLSYNLLRRLKSAELAQLRDCNSIEQAVQLLGRNELYRWLTMLLLKSPGNRKGVHALQEIALWRARLFELMAQQRHEPAPGQLFTLGLASMLGAMLKITPLEVVATLSLSGDGAQAILQQTGPWAAYLDIASAIESHALDDWADLTDAFGGVQQVIELSDQAWAWAASSVRFDPGQEESD